MLYKFNTTAKVPDQLLYPMYYHPNDIAMDAVKDFWKYLEANPNIHDFFSETRSGESGGKMLGVLVVQNTNGELFYLRGYSGKLGGKTELNGFVPQIYNYESDKSFFLPRTKDIVEITNQIIELEESYIKPLSEELDYTSKSLLNQLDKLRCLNKQNKSKRKELRSTASPEEIMNLNNESAKERREFKDFKRQVESTIQEIKDKLKTFKEEYILLKVRRKQMSKDLQNQLFKEVIIENVLGERQNVYSLFKETPPSAAGECAAPKLFQYAINNNLKPIALAEFWWGANNKSEVRKHKHFYPACKSKCSFILPFMLKGLNVQKNPLLEEIVFEINVLYEDEFIMAINKPAGLLSVRGNTELYSVQEWLVENRKIKGPGLVHRLDMATSGILLVGKTKYMHELLQKQFQNKTIKKEYTAILDGVLNTETGTIELPLRPDFEDRPRQMVCYDMGKYSKTEFKVLEQKNNKTLINFYPVTGRTHQLRVHSAHQNGLNISILGDKLYGRPDERMFLHASKIEFLHPNSKEKMMIESKISWSC